MLKTGLRLLGLVLYGFLLVALPGANPAPPPGHEAAYYSKLDNKAVQCALCPRRCVIPDRGRGFCRVRENRGGTLYSLVYGRPCSLGKEPIEKAPFFHFLPGRQRITVATVGCNQRCKYCQNWEISQARPEDVPARAVTPAEVVAVARAESVPIICFTYTEPVVFFEYVRDVAKLARAAGIRTCVVSGGYVNPEPLQELCGLVDAIKIDLKGFTDDFYRDVCGSSLAPVLAACRAVARSGTHLELVNLVVPALNDDTAEVGRMAAWVRDSLGADVPVHFTRFHPDYRLKNSIPTPVPTLEACADVAVRAGLRYVYIGNVPGHPRENTTCPSCGRLLVGRSGYVVTANHVRSGRCEYCRAAVAGLWD